MGESKDSCSEEMISSPHWATDELLSLLHVEKEPLASWKKFQLLKYATIWYTNTYFSIMYLSLIGNSDTEIHLYLGVNHFM